MVVRDRFILPGEGGAPNEDERQLPPRPKSRNDLEAVRIARYGLQNGSKGMRREVLKDPREIKDELDFTDWYGEFEDDLQEANNEYRYTSSAVQASSS